MTTKKMTVENINDEIETMNGIETINEIDDGYVNYEIPWERGQKTPCKNVIINGKKYSIPIGQKVRIPKVVAEVLEQSKAQDRYAEQVDKQMQKTQVTEF